MIRDLFHAYRQAFRIFVRQRTRPLTMEEAEEKRLFWSKCYMYSAFLTLCAATYMTQSRKINFSYGNEIPREEAVIQKLATGPTKVYKYRNFEKVDEFMYNEKQEPKLTIPFTQSNSVETSEKV